MQRTKRAFELVRDALTEIDNRLARLGREVGEGVGEIHSLVMGLQVALVQFHADQKARHEHLEADLAETQRRLNVLEGLHPPVAPTLHPSS
jgi:hypothetical protein